MIKEWPAEYIHRAGSKGMLTLDLSFSFFLGRNFSREMGQVGGREEKGCIELRGKTAGAVGRIFFLNCS